MQVGDRSRSSWRRLRERESLRSILALEVDEQLVYVGIDSALTQLDGTVVERLQRMSREAAMQEARSDFAKQSLDVCCAELQRRDARVLQEAATRGSDGLTALKLLGLLIPPWLAWFPWSVRNALDTTATNLDATRDIRAHELAQRVARTVSVDRGRAGGGSTARPLRALSHPAVANLLSSKDVMRLRNGRPVIIDPQPAWLTSSAFVEAEADLRRHIRMTCVPSRTKLCCCLCCISVPVPFDLLVECSWRV